MKLINADGEITPLGVAVLIVGFIVLFPVLMRVVTWWWFLVLGIS